MKENGNSFSRRKYLTLTGTVVAGMGGLAGCAGSNGGSSGDSSSDGGYSSGGSSGPVEILHGWTGGDGARAAEALESAFNEAYPDVNAEFNPIGVGGTKILMQSSRIDCRATTHRVRSPTGLAQT